MGILKKFLSRRRAEGYPGKGVFRRPGPLRKAVIDAELCSGCGECRELCSFGMIGVRRDGTHYVMKGCRGCGACFGRCSALAMIDISRKGNDAHL